MKSKKEKQQKKEYKGYKKLFKKKSAFFLKREKRI